MRRKISTNIVDGCTTDTKCEDSVHGRPKLKEKERKPHERSLYERTSMSEPFIEKHAISTELRNVNERK